MEKLKMALELQEISFERDENVQEILLADHVELGHVMYEAYLGTIDYSGESIEEAIEEVNGTLEGKYGKIINEACLQTKVEDEIASAIVCNILEKSGLPMITFAMTKAKFKGKGFSKKLIKEALMRLKDLGYKKCLLFVTDGNEPALSIYKKMGFQAV
ncbi:MAG: GNAT family N-acetyltransferase [Pseudobdellovibrionaceae bacterium]|nr:MAG: GNAT family N-acetyltransferase [Pseudobdellovibrionaceae bacterium]